MSPFAARLGRRIVLVSKATGCSSAPLQESALSNGSSKESRMNGKGKQEAGLAALVLAVSFSAHAQVDLTTLDRDMAGPRAQVLVLGSVHLRGLPKEFDAKTLDPVIERLVAFAPDIITIEALSGEECDLVARHPKVYGADFCSSSEAAKAATGLDVSAAIAEVNATLKTWPAQPTPAQRRMLASRFLAANDRASAYVQWLQLPAVERRAGDGLDDALVAMLREIETRNNESYQIAATLAARLGLQRVHAIDNHTGDNLQIADEQAFATEIRSAWDAGKAQVADMEQREQQLQQSGDMLALYRYINRPENMRARAEVNAGATMRAQAPNHYPQMWVGGWEIRNLRMVANIRETFRERPGARVLVVVGASHKPWFDSWLGQLQGVDIVDVAKALR
jgi:hypothetical protein